MAEDWQPAPAVSSGLPLTFQVGTVGAGIGIGCGIGVGFGGPISLGAVPVLGQASQGIQAGLGGLSAALGGAGATVRAAVKSLGISGLDAGFGCGVGIGYGFGAGLMLKPSAVEQLMRAGSQFAGHVTTALNSKLQQAGVQQQKVAGAQRTSDFFTNGSTPVHDPNVHGTAQTHSSQQQQQSQQRVGNAVQPVPATPSVLDISGMVGEKPADGNSSNSNTLVQGAGLQPQQHDPVVFRALLQQHEEIARLRRQNKQLRAAVCKLDPSAEFCARRGDKGGSSGRSASTAHSSDEWSDL